MSDRWDLELSCMVDGACDPQAQRALLDACRGDAAITGLWTRYHSIGALMRGETTSAVDLTGRVAAAIATDPVFESRRNVLHFPVRMKRASIGLALAASFATATVLGLRMFSATDPVPPVASRLQDALATGTSGTLASAAPDRSLPLGGTQSVDAAPVWAVPGGTDRSGVQSAAVLMQPGALPNPDAREELLQRRMTGVLNAPDEFAEYLGQHREYSFLGTVPVDLVSGELALDAPEPAPR